MSGKMIINVGTSADDHTGDPLRTAMQKSNFNFTEIYNTTGLDANTKNLHVSNTVFLGNSSVNGAITATNYSGTSHNAILLGNVDSSFYVQNNDSRILSGNLTFSAANVYFNKGLFVNTTIVANSSGLYSNGIVNAVSARMGYLTVDQTAYVNGAMEIAGDLIVSGQTTIVNATIITTKDKNFILAYQANATAANNAGIVVGLSANLVYNNSQGSWQSNVNFTAASNNLSLGTNTNVWNIYANNVNAAVYTVGSSFTANLSQTTINQLFVQQNTSTNNAFVNNFIKIGNTVGYAFGSSAKLQIEGRSTTYIQAVIQNANSDISSTSDLVVTADTGNDSTNYVDLGINSSTYANLAYSIGGPLDAYLYSSNSNLIIGTASANSIIFHTGNTTAINERVRITPTGNVGIGNTMPGTLLVVSSNPSAQPANAGLDMSVMYPTQIAAQDGYENKVVLDSNTYSSITGRVYSNTAIAPVAISANTIMLALSTRGYGTTGWVANASARIAMISQELFTDTATGTYIQFSTSNTGTKGVSEKVRITADGNTGIGNSYPIDTLRVEGAHSVLTSITVANLSQNAFVSNTTGMYHVGYANAFTHTANTGSNTWWANSTTMYLANTSASVTVVPQGITVANLAGYVVLGNSTVNSIANTTTFYTTNSTGTSSLSAYGLNVSANSSGYIVVGNTTVNSYSNSSTRYVSNSTGTVTTTAYGITVSANVNSYVSVGNATTNSTVNTSGLYTTGVLNTGNNATVNGYISVSNGFISTNTYVGAYAGGIVVDYINTMGRISVGQASGLSIYSNGVGNVVMMVSNTTGVYSNGLVNAASYNVGTNFIANTTGIYHTGLVNAASYNVGTNFIANTTGIYHTGLVNAASYNVGTNFIANTTGAYHTGTINAASYTVGTNVVINATSVYTNNDLILTNNKTLRFTTLSGSANVGFRHQNDDNFVFYSTDTTGTQRAVWSVFANSATSNLSVSIPINVGANLTTSGLIGAGITPAGAFIKTAAGNTTVAPLLLSSGTNLTSPVAGAIEYDGNYLYGTPNSTSGRAFIPVAQIFRLTSAGSAIGSTIADFFGSTSSISLAASSAYEIELFAYFTKTTAGTATWQITASSAPTLMSGSYTANPITGIAAGAPTTGYVGSQASTTAVFGATGTLTTGVNHAYSFKFQVITNLATNIRLQLTQSAGTATPLAGSYYTVKALSTSTGSFAA